MKSLAIRYFASMINMSTNTVPKFSRILKEETKWQKT